MSDAQAGMTRKQIRAVFRRHRGAVVQLARTIGVNRVTVSEWLRGKATSRKIADAAALRAAELLAEESRENAA
jgi:hypothetical protein